MDKAILNGFDFLSYVHGGTRFKLNTGDSDREVTFVKLSVILYLASRQTAPVFGDAAQELNFNRPKLSRTVDFLVKHNLVIRDGVKDQRTFRLTLTQRGRDLALDLSRYFADEPRVLPTAAAKRPPATRTKRKVA